MPGHNLPMAVMGTFVLAFGWFGFNAGSTLAASEPRIAAIAVNTAIASATGAITSLGYVWQRHRRPDVAMACNGMLGGPGSASRRRARTWRRAPPGSWASWRGSSSPSPSPRSSEGG